MTLNDYRGEQGPLKHAGPTPPSAQAAPDHLSSRRFTVRDGFHLKTRNAEVHAAIDAQLASREEPAGALAPPETTEDGLDNTTPGPARQDITSVLPLPSPQTTINNNLEDRRQNDDVGKAEAPEDRDERVSSTAVAVLDQLRQHDNFSQHSGRSNGREVTTGRVRAALRAPAEWLIYRRRPSETQQRKQRKVDKLLNDVLQEPEPQTMKHDEVRTPRRPRCQSILGSTYSQRVAAARPTKQQSRDNKHHHHRELLQPLTETERGLLRSREDNNKEVDKLLVSLFHPPGAPSTPSSAGTTFIPIVKPATPTNRFPTRRSIMRHETAVALRSRNLVSRMNELRTLPQLLEQMEALQLWKKQQHIAEHGVDIVARNRANPASQVLQKPSQTPLLPSATDHKVHQANKRKQELDAAKEESVRRIVIRWQIRREERAEQARRVHVQSQWLLVVALAKSSSKWLAKFHEFRLKRSALVRVIMAKRLQHYWRQRTLVKRNSLQLLRFAPSTPLSSAFFRMPVVIHAVSKLQQSIRDWLDQKHHRERKEAVALIVTAWFEFQDVKFRRIILRFRKRVRDFQIMWRAWRAITAARIKLLLLVWAKLERKLKRRHGVTAAHPMVTFSLGPDALQVKATGGAEATPGSGGGGWTLLDMLQRAATERPSSQQHKQLEDMHRHFRNGGAVHMPISAVSLGQFSPPSTNSPSLGLQASPPSPSSRKSDRPRAAESAHVRQDLQLRSNMGEEFQLVMYDVYTTRQGLSPASKSPVRAQPRPPLKSHKAPPPQPPVPSAANVPVPPPSKKVPHQLKVAVLRKLLSEKRKTYSDARDRGREAWAAARKQMRSETFRYDVLDELAAFQQLQAKYATFLLLHSVTETEMVRLIHQTQEEANAADSAGGSTRRHRKSLRRSHGQVDMLGT
ncbi:hypothetical protein PR003_g6719 [Phytophthora rubi]|uniref:Uncharacterized protein n=1 Tax=Phytophthora rubi TaxID=129364 RepID=A0A6A4FP01_9STRA|nr:hypothetical protein PR003_g6719 [Phytophthora rubi]